MSQASISGFTFIRNGVELGFPFEASIRSLLPLVDEFVVVVGKSNDDTLARIHAIGSPKIRVIETIWNERMADRGFVYAQQKMIAQFACTGDWAFNLEGDEVVHEAELANIRAAFSTVRTSDGAGAGCGAGERRRSPTGHAPTARACFAPPPPAVRWHDAVRAAQVLVEDADADSVVETVVTAANTGRIGDGKVWVVPVDSVTRVRTGEKGSEAI
jgi:glycosyltransferase involved in cell wall biosynthesis